MWIYTAFLGAFKLSNVSNETLITLILNIMVVPITVKNHHSHQSLLITTGVNQPASGKRRPGAFYYKCQSSHCHCWLLLSSTTSSGVDQRRPSLLVPLSGDSYSAKSGWTSASSPLSTWPGACEARGLVDDKMHIRHDWENQHHPWWFWIYRGNVSPPHS